MTKRKFLKRHIKNIISEFSFKNRSQKHPDACPLYKTKKPCHKMKNLNCFFCYCPEYDISRPEGGCKRKSKAGKWFHSKKLPGGKMWDCSDCTYPHQEKVVEEYLRKFFKSQ